MTKSQALLRGTGHPAGRFLHRPIRAPPPVHALDSTERGVTHLLWGLAVAVGRRVYAAGRTWWCG